MKRDAGFTLVEVMISIVLLATGLFGLLSMLTTAMSANRFSYDGTNGVQFAEYMVDVIRVNGGSNNGRYNGMDTNACGATADCEPWRIALRDSGLLNPRGTVTVQSNIPTARTDTVEVKVEWGAAGARHDVTLRTIIETWN